MNRSRDDAGFVCSFKQEPDSLAPIGGFATNLPSWLRFQYPAQPFTHNVVVVSQQDASRLHSNLP